MMLSFALNTGDISLLKELVEAVKLAQSQMFEVNLWNAQNIFWSILQTTYNEYKTKSQQGDGQMKEWLQHFSLLGGYLSIRMN